jgi:hypothetical protein
MQIQIMSHLVVAGMQVEAGNGYKLNGALTELHSFIQAINHNYFTLSNI